MNELFKNKKWLKFKSNLRFLFKCKSKKVKIIYHTSHCGSTLLTALLSQSTAAFAEPQFKDLIPNIDEVGYTITDRNLQSFYDYIISKGVKDV